MAEAVAAPAGTPPAPNAPQGTAAGAAPAGKPGQAPNVAKESAARGSQPPAAGQSTATKPPATGGASPTEPPAPEKPKGPIKKTLKYNGKDVVMEFADEAHFERELQRLYGEGMRGREFQEERARFMKARDAAKAGKDPFALYKEIDPDFDVEDFLLNRTKALLDEEDRKKNDPTGWELEQTKKQLQEFQQREQEAKTQREQEQVAKQAEQFKQRMAQEWGTELRRLGFDSEFTKANLIPRMVDLFETNKAKNAGWTTAQMVDHIGWELRTAGLNHIKSLRGSALLEALGPELVNEIRRSNLEAANALPPKPAPKPVKDESHLTQREKNDAMLNIGRSTWRFK